MLRALSPVKDGEADRRHEDLPDGEEIDARREAGRREAVRFEHRGQRRRVERPRRICVALMYWIGAADRRAQRADTCEWVTTASTCLKVAVPPMIALKID